MQIKITRTIDFPDPVRLARYRHCPDLGPKILFFSGGSALKNTAAELIQYTHNSIHIITPFDSGGSSAVLREAFKMPAVGDVRNRLLALADRSFHGNPEVLRFFAHRFPGNTDQNMLEWELEQMIKNEHPLISNIPDPMQKIICHHLNIFKNYMPDTFNLKKASLGNLVLSAGYLDSRRNFDTILYIFSKLVHVRGIVRPVVNKYLHLITELENGQIIAGQHNLTGKETAPISSKVKKLWLSSSRKNPVPAEVCILKKMAKLISKAELICYPVGSFYSSIIANLLPSGVGKAISQNPCPKIFIPNTGNKDPETYSLDINEQIEQLLSYLRKDDPGNISVNNVLNFIIIDKENGNYPGNPDKGWLKNMDINIINTPLVSQESRPFIDARLLVSALLSLA
ncbi:UPF0052 [Desulfonema limicola]|uniref:UPF0052 n=1 Tax=Desulfonema limicola TaxID=45656 RepID=A0A975BDY4_9BACT|nr:GAK system CofD-like protein [Desulfonema limicola]QTA83586.1 UPF0052 [Desulfonema limicola]